MLNYILAILLLQVTSYFFPPSTANITGSIVNTIFSLIIIFLAAYWLFKKDLRGWYIIFGEIILGGSGNYLALIGISLRTSLLIVAIIIYGLNYFKEDWRELKTDRFFFYSTLIILSLLLISSLAAINGYLHNNNPTRIVSDLIPYTYLLYFFPLRRLLTDQNFVGQITKLVPAAIVGYSIIFIFTFLGFSLGLFQVHNLYYWWWRDVVLGKATDLGFNFYRLVLDLHLILVPITIYYVNKVIEKQTKKIDYYILALLLVTLAINLTRVYYLAFAIGLVFLARKLNWKRWLVVSASSLAFIFLAFTTIHLTTSFGKSLGWEIFGLRIQSIAKPNLEESSLSRMILLPKIWEKIKSHPIIGEGLGSTVTAFSPVAKATITTPHFDWGYLEIWTEVGLIGLLLWLVLLIFIAYLLRQNKNSSCWLSILVTLLVINLTSPALFHVLGILLLVYLLASALASKTKLTHAS